MRRLVILALSLFISLSICAATLYRTIDAETWAMVGDTFQRFLLLALLVVAGEVFWRTVRQTVMASAIQQRLSMRASAKITLISDFACTVTPSRIGGEPTRLYGLVRAGLSWGNAGALLAGEFVTDAVFLLSLLTTVALWDGNGTPGSLVQVMTFETLWPIALVLSTFTLGGYLVLRHVHLIERWCLFILRTALIRRLVGPSICERAEQTIRGALRELRTSTTLLLARGKGRFFLAYLTTVGHGLFRFAVLPLLAVGLGIDISLRTLVIWQLIAFYGLSFAPTPGGSGALELGFVLFYAPFVPTHKLGLLLVAWRFFTYYIYLIVGGAVLGYSVRGRMAEFWKILAFRRAPVPE